MAAQSAPKVVLKSTTKMSLNERFTNMLKNKQPMPVNIRATMQQQQLASARNRRLAQQMENRPSVQAALKLKQRIGRSRGCIRELPGASPPSPTADLTPTPSRVMDGQCRPAPGKPIQHFIPLVSPIPNPLHDSCPFPNLLFQKSLKQRLGKSNIQARLGRPAGTLARGALGSRGLALGQRGMPRGALRGRGARAMLRGGVTLRD